MSNELATMPEKELNNVLRNSLYPNASDMSLELVKGYCKAANLDIMLKPVHIVAIYNSAVGRMVDVIMPGIGLYRTTAARTKQYAGISEPVFGPTVTRKIGNTDYSFPEWCKVTVKRKFEDTVAEFTALEYWLENYAVKGGKEKSIEPNAMWAKRPFGQLKKCAEAQALRMAFPEVGEQPTADEMEGKEIGEKIINPMPDDKPPVDIAALLKSITIMSIEDFKTIDKDSLTVEQQRLVSEAFKTRKAAIKEASVVAEVKTEKEPDGVDWVRMLTDADYPMELAAIFESVPDDELTAVYGKLNPEVKAKVQDDYDVRIDLMRS